MNLLVTGGAGFIGSHFVLRHKEQFPDDLVIVLDKLTYAGSKEFLDPVIDRIRFLQGDISDYELVSKTVERYGINAIINFAAETHVDRSISNALPFIHTNIIGVQSLIEVCRRNPELLLLHVSTDEVYGDLQDDDPGKTEEDPLRPSSPYAASKASGDLLIMAAIRTHGIRARITRCTNNYGPHQAEEKFIPTIIKSALANTPIPLYGKGENKRDWLYVTDHCDAVEAVLKADDVDGFIFNISANDERRNIEVAEMVLAILKKPRSLISFVTDRPGHDWRYALDSSAIRTLGWKTEIGFEEGLGRTVEWYRERL